MSRDFASRLLAWFDVAGRKDLPWQRERSAYRVWVSEVMLQQTQVSSVIPYFERFMGRFPSLAALAAAPSDAVLEHWAGLGYYARGRNLHRAAKAVMATGADDLPQGRAALEALPGIGRSTAAAICALARDEPEAILDGNVKRVLARHRAIAGWPGDPKVAKVLWAAAEAYTPKTRVADYTQAIMDLGALLCTARAPDCAHCPVAQDCRAYSTGRVAEFPGRKASRRLPERSCCLLLLENAEGAVWLEQRPPSGIWGGLYCPPQFNNEEELRATVSALGLKPELNTLPPLTHSFTHFKLTIQPLLARNPLTPNPRAVMEARQGLWYKPGQTGPQPALPAPIARLFGAWGQNVPPAITQPVSNNP